MPGLRPLATSIALLLMTGWVVGACARAEPLPPEKAAMESRAAAIRSSAPVTDKSSDPGRPVEQTDPPPEVGVLGNINAPAPESVFTASTAWAGWVDPSTYVQVWAGVKGDGTGAGVLFVMRRRGIGDGVHLAPDSAPTATFVDPPKPALTLRISAVAAGKLQITDSSGNAFVFDPATASFDPS